MPEQLIDISAWPLDDLARQWRAAKPFPHLVIDGFLAPGALTLLRAAFEWEQHWPLQDDIFTFLASADTPTQPVLRQFGEELGAERVRGAITRISGLPLSSADVRGYVYLPGHYLLPHTDCRATERRAVAYVYYLDQKKPLRGGELELFSCKVRGETVTSAKPALRIAPKPNRLVLFAVDFGSLHQVREVLSGARLSLAGWFRA